MPSPPPPICSYPRLPAHVQAVKPALHPIGKFEVITMTGGSIESFHNGLESHGGDPPPSPTSPPRRSARRWYRGACRRRGTVRAALSARRAAARSRCGLARFRPASHLGPSRGPARGFGLPILRRRLAAGRASACRRAAVCRSWQEGGEGSAGGRSRGGPGSALAEAAPVQIQEAAASSPIRPAGRVIRAP